VSAPQQPIEPIRSVEQEHPWLWALYLAAGAAAIAISACLPLGFATFVK
jgi:hypothetical protein